MQKIFGRKIAMHRDIFTNTCPKNFMHNLFLLYANTIAEYVRIPHNFSEKGGKNKEELFYRGKA